MEFLFDCNNCSKSKKVKLVVIEFSYYTITWLDQVVISRRRNRERPIETWDEMISLMRRRFLPLLARLVQKNYKVLHMVAKVWRIITKKW